MNAIEINKEKTFELARLLHENDLIALYAPRQHYRCLPYGIFPSTDAQYRYMRSRFGNLFNARFWDDDFCKLFLVLEKVLGENYMECVQFSRSGRSCCLNLSLI